MSQKLPDGWSLRPLGRYCHEVVNRNSTSEDYEVLTCSKIHGVIPQAQKFGKVIASKDRRRYKAIRRDHLYMIRCSHGTVR